MKALKIHYIALAISIIFITATAIGFLKFSTIMNNRKNRVIDVKERLAIYKGNKEIFEEETKQLKNLIDRTTKLETYLVTPTSLPLLLSSIEDLAKESNTEFNISSAQNSGKLGTEKLIISFVAKGSLQSIDKFLEKLAHQSYQINFTKFYLFSETDSSEIIVNSTKKTVSNRSVPTTWELTASIEIVSFSI